MTVRVIPFLKEHYLLMDRAITLDANTPDVIGPFMAARENEKTNFTIVDEQTYQILFVGGFVPIWEQRAKCWAVFSKSSGKKMKILVSIIRHFIEKAPFKRIEAEVVCDFPAAHKLVKMLGFKLEASFMEHYNPDGASCAMYAKIKGAQTA